MPVLTLQAAEAGSDMSAKSSTLRAAIAVMRHFIADDRGATSIEYCMVASGVAGAIITIVYGLGSSVRTNLYNKIALIIP
jgi:pilus assembly protein Flp/PilA